MPRVNLSCFRQVSLQESPETVAVVRQLQVQQFVDDDLGPAGDSFCR
jgi:hypothetical protein